MARVYSSTSVATTLASTITDIATSITVTSGGGAPLIQGAGFINGDIFTIAIDPDTQTEEICYVTANAGDTFTITRGEAGTSGITHASGATVRHVLTSDDLDYFRNGVVTADAAIPASTLTTKGDLLSRTTATLQRLPVGTNGHILTADSTQTAGIKWAASPTEIPTQTGNGGKYLTTSGTALSWSPVNVEINAKTDNYTLIASDAGKLITMDSSSNKTIIVPNGIFTVGQQIAIAGLGTGVVTIDSDGTSVLYATPGTLLRTQYSTAALVCIATNTFLLLGDLAV
jgi:hypothetical protein